MAVIPSHVKILIVGPYDGVVAKILEPIIDAGILPKERIIPYHHNRIYHAKRLWYCDGEIHIRSSMKLTSSPAMQQTAPQHIICLAYEYAVPTPGVVPDQVVVIHREKGHSRSLRNEDDVIKMIESKGEKVKLFIPSKSFSDDIRLFRTAKAVVAPHGAGLFNVLWTPQGTPVMEFGYTTGMEFPDEYFEVSVASGRRYFCSIADGDYGTPLQVNIAEADQIFTKMVEYMKEREREQD